jgi:hypothetical protein
MRLVQPTAFQGAAIGGKRQFHFGEVSPLIAAAGLHFCNRQLERAVRISPRQPQPG